MNNINENLLFIIPSQFFVEDYHERLFFNSLPIEALQLSSLLRDRGGIKTHFIDLRFERETKVILTSNKIDEAQFKEAILQVLENNRIQEFRNIGIISTSSSQFLQMELIAKTIKSEFPKTNLIVGGYHPTAVPEDFTCKGSPYDYVIKGEMENVFLELIESNILKKNNPPQKPELLSSQKILDLNLLPFPDYELYLEQYPLKNKFEFKISMSRGCPFNCTFCRIIKNHPIRSFSLESFQKHFKKLLQVILKYNKRIPKVGFTDQSFNSVSISKKVLKYIIHNEFQEDFKFSCQTRLEIIHKHDELIDLFKKSRMIVGFGFESANNALLLEMKKTKNPAGYIKKMKDILNVYKAIIEIYCRINVIAGFPGENQESFDETIDFINENALHENIQISPSLFLNDPSTQVYDNMSYYEMKYGSEFVKEWWKIPSDPHMNAVILKPSRNYSKKQLIGDYKDKYSRILNRFKHSPFLSIISWKQYFNKLYGKLN